MLGEGLARIEDPDAEVFVSRKECSSTSFSMEEVPEVRLVIGRLLLLEVKSMVWPCRR